MGGRARVARVECVVLGALAEGPRARLVDRLYGLWAEHFVGIDRETFVRTHLFDHTRVVMAFGAAADLAGFANINPYLLEVGGRRHLVLASGFFNRLDYAGTARLGLRCVWEVLRLRARHPGLVLAGVAIATSPLSYNLPGKLIPRFYPHPDRPAPADVPPLLAELARRRDLRVDPADPFKVRFPVRLGDVDRVRASRTYRAGSRWMSWYEARLPTWTSGDALMMWFPIDVPNTLGVLWNVLRGRAEGDRRG